MPGQMTNVMEEMRRETLTLAVIFCVFVIGTAASIKWLFSR